LQQNKPVGLPGRVALMRMNDVLHQKNSSGVPGGIVLMQVIGSGYPGRASQSPSKGPAGFSRPFRPRDHAPLVPRASAFGRSPGLGSPGPLGRFPARGLKSDSSDAALVARELHSRAGRRRGRHRPYSRYCQNQRRSPLPPPASRA
jgi:hypothetical protein